MITKDMTIEDFIRVMTDNKQILPDFDSLPLESKEYLARINMMTGTAKTIADDEGMPLGCAGVRYAGIGYAWCITPPYIRDEKKFTLLRNAREFFNQQVDELNLWRVFADSVISDNFLRHLGFQKADNIHIWTRTK